MDRYEDEQDVIDLGRASDETKGAIPGEGEVGGRFKLSGLSDED